MSTVAVNPEVLHENRKVLVALPWYKSASPLTTFSLLAMMDRSRMAVSLGFGDAFIAHSRNKLATQFVNTDFEWMLMVDDDMVIPFGNAEWFNSHTGFRLKPEFAGLHTIDRLLSHGKTIVGGMYFGRWRAGHPVFAEGKQMEDHLRKHGPMNEVRPTRWVGTGCTLFHRSVFLDIEKAFPFLSRKANEGTGQWFTSSEHDLNSAVDDILDAPKQTAEQMVRKLREAKTKSGVHSSLGMGEDVQLCIRATQAGHQPHIDLGLWCGHVGGCVYPILPR